MGLDNEFGSIKAGKTADLIISDSDLLEDYTLIGGKFAALFMDGEPIVNHCGL